MAPSFSRAIYPSGIARFMPYILVLLVIKFCRSFALFLTYDLLKVVNVIHLLFIIQLGSSIIYIILQKPFSSGKRLSKFLWFRIIKHAIVGTIISLLWLFSLTLCGPLRSILIYEHSDVAVIAGAGALFSNVGGPANFRGAVFYLVSLMTLLLFDHDDNIHTSTNPDIDITHSIFSDLFDHFSNMTGLSDHKGGVVLLFVSLCLKTLHSNFGKRLAVDVGGAKRLHSLSTLMSTVFLVPWVFALSFSVGNRLEFSSVLPILIIILFGFVFDFYIESVCSNKLEASRAAQISTLSAIVSGFIISLLWNHPFLTQITADKIGLFSEDHMLSGGLIFSFVLIIYANQILTGTSSNRNSKGSLIGYSAAGLPLYSFTGDALHRTSQSLLSNCKIILRSILENRDSRKIFYFLCVNIFFTFVELIYGVWTNSLGLISDGFHMFFDCSALVMGLYAAVMSKWKATRIYSYGFDRVEILSGFINALFLVVISFFVFSAALSRIYDPPVVKTEKLLTVSVIGLFVNLFGIMAFRHSHSHGGVGSHGHSHGGTSSHGHSHQTQQSDKTENTNMQGVFLHVVADTLGSLGVIFSTLLIQTFGWNIADPICSLFIAILIFASVLPLIHQTTMILLLRTPPHLQKQLGHALDNVLKIDGIVGYRQEHFWNHSSSVVCGTIHIQINEDTSEQKMISQVSSLFKEVGVNNITVQVEKPAFFRHMTGLGVSLNDVYQMTKEVRSRTGVETSDNFIKSI